MLDPQRTAAKLATARDTSRNFLDQLLFPSAAAATMELPPPQPPAQIAVRPAAPVGNVRISDGSKQQSVANAAKRVGIHPVYLAAVMSLETSGTFDPRSRNSLGYVGLIQFGAWEQKNYRVSRNTPFEDQAAAAAQFLIDRGVKPGDGIDRIYAAVLIGNADGKLEDGSDGMNTKDQYGTSVNNALKRLSPGGGHYNNAVRFLRGG